MIELNHVEVKGKLHDITLKVQDHAFICIQGPDGSGKKTLMDVCTGFQRVDQGTVCIMDHTKLRNRLYRRKMDYLTSDPYWAYDKTIYQNIWLTTNRRIMDRALHEVGLNDGYLYLYDCSKEQKKQIMLARMLIKSPKVVFLYEWLNDLDSQAAQRMMERLHQVYLQHAFTIVFASCQFHDGYRHVLLNHGYVVADHDV